MYFICLYAHLSFYLYIYTNIYIYFNELKQTLWNKFLNKKQNEKKKFVIYSFLR